MSGSSRLRDRFVDLYPSLMQRLVRKLGSPEAAEDALGDAFLKVDRMPAGQRVDNPAAYLFRIALNAASDRRRSDKRLATATEIEAAMAVADPMPDAHRTAEARDAIAALQHAIEELPSRRRRVLEAVRLQERSCREVAEELGVSRRTVELELRQALDHCAERLARSGFDYAFAAAQTSIQ